MAWIIIIGLIVTAFTWGIWTAIGAALLGLIILVLIGAALS